MIENRFARRAAGLPSTLKPPHFPSEFDADVILFDSGFAAPSLLPDLSVCALEALTTHRESSLQYAPAQGQPELRQWLANEMNGDGCALAPDEVQIVNGAKNGLDLVCRLLLDEGDAIAVTAPTYFTAIPIFRTFGVEFIEVPQDAEGLQVTELEAALDARRKRGLSAPKFVYNVPEFHNPTGATMSASRRRELIDLTARADIFIVEDSPYRRVRFEGQSLPSLKSLDRAGNVIHLGTFSKLIAPGLRIGWIAAREALIARLVRLKSDGAASPLVQRIVYEFVTSSSFDEHVATVRRVYRERRDSMIAALGRHMPEVGVRQPEGGYYVWLSLPERIDGDALAERARERGVHVISGSSFFASGPSAETPRNHVRLSYSHAPPDRIEAGVERLAGAYGELAG